VQGSLWESSEARTFDAERVLCDSFGKGIQEVNLPVAIFWDAVSARTCPVWE